MNDESRIAKIFTKLTDYSPIFYIAMLVILIGVSVNFFNNEIMNTYVLEILILLNTIPLTSFVYMKLAGKSIRSNPSLVCPDCSGKMKTKGNWECMSCGGIFKHGKKQN